MSSLVDVVTMLHHTNDECDCIMWLKDSDGDFSGNVSQQASPSDDEFDGSSDSDGQRKKKKKRPVIPGERKSTRSRRVAGSAVCYTCLEPFVTISERDQTEESFVVLLSCCICPTCNISTFSLISIFYLQHCISCIVLKFQSNSSQGFFSNNFLLYCIASNLCCRIMAHSVCKTTIICFVTV